MIHVLDHGYIRLVNSMGTDLDVINAARVSFDKEKQEFDSHDDRLLQFLVKHHHDSVFRHCAATFEVYAPLMVARQWWKHVVGSSHLDDQTGWNETSRRYVTEASTFYIPDPNEWRAAPQDKKQGSSGLAEPVIGAKYTQALRKMVRESVALYDEALRDGLAPEQARLLLPANALYVRWRWTASLNALLNFLDLRLGHGAQSEIAEYAEAIERNVQNLWPKTYAAWGLLR